MSKLIYLSILFVIAVAVSFYFSAEGFDTGQQYYDVNGNPITTITPNQPLYDISGNLITVASVTIPQQQPQQPQPLYDLSGNLIQTPAAGMQTDLSGNLLGTRLKDLLSILTQPSLNVTPQASQAAQAPILPTSEPAAPTLDQYYQALKPTLQQDISQAVQSGFERSTVQPIAQSATTTPSVAQGASWPSPGAQTQQPDMNNYVRKDSIPCWGCSLDY